MTLNGKASRSDTKLNIIEHPHCASNGANVTRWRQNARGLLDHIRRLVLSKNPVLDELSQEGVTGVTKFVGSAASKHKEPPKYGVVWCDEAGRLYRIDRATDQYVPIRPPD
jgi:hypothetical protein